MDSRLGPVSRRAWWLALALAVLSLLATLFAPVAGALQAILWLVLALGIRRGQWPAPVAAVVIGSVGMVGALIHGAAVAGAGGIIWGAFTALCAYIFVRAALDLRGDGRAASKWPWLALMCGYGVFWLCFEAYYMPTASMENTILQNESVLVEKASTHLGVMPHDGDLVVFRYPIDRRQVFVKRVVGAPGDRLRIVDKQLVRNGSPVAEPYAFHSSTNTDSYRDNFPSEPNTTLPAPAVDMLRNDVRNGEVVVPPGKYFVLGDSRDDSLDSRYSGFVSTADIIGRPLLVYASYDLEHDGVKGMATAFNTRWNRLLKVL
jgi:signal peptidase I